MTREALSIKKNFIWNMAGNFVYLFTQWLLTFVVVQILGFEEAGIFSLAISIAGIFVGIALYGMRTFQASDVNGTYSEKVYILSRYITSAIALICCVFFIVLNGYSPYIAACVIIYMVFKVSEAISDVYQGIFQKAMRMDFIGKSFIIKAIVPTFAFIGIVIFSQNLLLATFALCICSFAVVFIYDLQKAKKFFSQKKQDLDFANVKSLLITCLPLAVFSVIFNATAQIPRYFLDLQLGAEALGIYASIAIPVAIIQVSASFLFAPLVTPFAYHLHEGDMKSFRTLLKKIILLMLGLVGSSIVLFVFLGDWALVLLFGEKIVPYTYLLLPLVACTILVAFSWFLSTIIVVLRKLKSLLVAALAAFFLICLGSVPLINFFGMNGASIVLCIGLGLYCLLAAMIMIKEIKVYSKKL